MRPVREVRLIDGVACYECTNCMRWKPIESGFYRVNHPNVKSGRRSHCIVCEKGKHRTHPNRKEYAHAYYLANRDKWKVWNANRYRKSESGASSTITI